LIITLIILGVLNTLIAFLALARTGRIITDQDDFSDALVQATNFQTNKLNLLTEKIDHCLDSLLTIDANATSSPDIEIPA
jgi:hypothetical protein